MSKMYNIYLFILICTWEEVEPWSLLKFSRESITAAPQKTTQSGELITSLLVKSLNNASVLSPDTKLMLFT